MSKCIDAHLVRRVSGIVPLDFHQVILEDMSAQIAVFRRDVQIELTRKLVERVLVIGGMQIFPSCLGSDGRG